MNWIDIIIFAVTAYLIFQGWRKGLVRTIFHYLSIFAGVAVAISYREAFAWKLKSYGLVLPEFWQQALAFILLFIITAALVQGIGLFTSKLLKPTPLGPLDRICGALLGFAKAALACILVTFLLTLLPKSLSMDSYLGKSEVLSRCRIFLPWLERSISENPFKLLPIKKDQPTDSEEKQN
jgi:uncharacterized membrane protein required for colicin V production